MIPLSISHISRIFLSLSILKLIFLKSSFLISISISLKIILLIFLKVLIYQLSICLIDVSYRYIEHHNSQTRSLEPNVRIFRYSLFYIGWPNVFGVFSTSQPFIRTSAESYRKVRELILILIQLCQQHQHISSTSILAAACRYLEDILKISRRYLEDIWRYLGYILWMKLG